MTGLGKFWTGAVAYVSLLVGAGLSVAGNLADTYRIRGQATDAVDIVLAVGPPLATLLVAELFVSEWPRTWSVQSVRYVAMAVVGTLATVVSWLHINELLIARGQLPLVAILWPMAIDGLAIMAMAKILVMRGHVASSHVATATRHELASLAEAVASGQTGGQFVATAEDVATSQAALATSKDIDWDAEMAKWEQGVDMAIRDLGQDVASEAEQYVAKVTGHPLPKRPIPVSQGVPAEAAELLRAWNPLALPSIEVDELLAAYFGKSARTARRWRAMVLGSVSSPPAGEG